MTSEEAIQYLNSPPWHAAGAPTLDNIRALLARLGDPQKRLRFVHVAGTNGKGSICAMLAGILRAAGYKTGLFTSPHLVCFHERIRIDGACIGDGALADLTETVKAAAEALGAPLTVFELITAVGFLYFAREKCDVVVLEVGLGGRFDATNVIDTPDCAVIANIGLDHTAILGGTLEQIAAEKAGIIKPGGAVALYEPEDDGVLDVIAGVCREKGASLRLADFGELEVLRDGLDGQTFCYCDDTPLRLPLPGDHQLRNAATALEAVEILRERRWRISAEAVEQGLAQVRWPARFELVAERPYFIVDGGHNPQCAAAIAENVTYYFSDRRRVLLIGMLRDKDADGFLDSVAPAADAFVCAAPESARALPAAELGEKLRRYEKPVFVCATAQEAVETARAAAGTDGAVCACGSLYLAGELLELFGKGIDE